MTACSRSSRVFKPQRMPICIKSAEVVIEGGAAASVAAQERGRTPVPQIKRVGEN